MKKKALHPLTYKRPGRSRTERPVVNAVQGNAILGRGDAWHN